MSQILSASYDPSVSGLPGNVGDIVGVAGGASAWVKFDTGVTDWRAFPGEAGGGVDLTESLADVGGGPALLKYAADGTPSAAVAGVDYDIPITDKAIAVFRAQLLLGSTMTKVIGTDFEDDLTNQIGTIVAAGTLTTRQDVAGGVITLSSTAAATHGLVWMPHGAVPFVANPTTDKWYIRSRAKVATAVDAQTDMGIGFTKAADPTNFISLVFGADCSGNGGDATHFSWSVYNAAHTKTANGVTAVAMDTNFHVKEVYSDGTTVHFLIAGVEVATTLASNLTTAPQTLAALVYNGSTAAARDLWLDSIYGVGIAA